MKNTRYCVSFFKRLYDCNGHSHECVQGEVEVLASNDSEAVDIARRRFAELKGIGDWSLFADYEKVWRIAGRADASVSAGRRLAGRQRGAGRSRKI